MTREEAIEILKDFHDKSALFSVRTALETLHPELKESEDERIRKAILNHLKRMWGNSEDDVCGVHVEDAIAWLEKQGEKPQGKTYIFEGKSVLEAINKEKVEPKFKVGDWIANDYCMGKVIALTDDAYLLDTEQGIPFSCEHNAHLWTIQDAKPGDVLQLGEVTAIFKEYIGNGDCKCYCSVYRGEFEIPTQDSSYGCHNATPATKEQRDLLFSKMKEAGYEWDAEKLEPIKVPKIKEPEGALKQLLDEQEKLYKEAEIILENKDTALAFLKRTGIIDENGELSEKYRSDQIPATTISVGNGINSTAITDGNTSVTSEEVERQYCTEQYEPDVRDFPIEWKEENVDLPEFDSHLCLMLQKFRTKGMCTNGEIIDYVKEHSQKLRDILVKPAWSEEDDVAVKDVCDKLNRLSMTYVGNESIVCQEEIKWLKSLKERYTWKPSDEQMRALHDMNLTGNISYAGQGQTLIELYNDLKKLKEE